MHLLSWHLCCRIFNQCRVIPYTSILHWLHAIAILTIPKFRKKRTAEAIFEQNRRNCSSLLSSSGFHLIGDVVFIFSWMCYVKSFNLSYTVLLEKTNPPLSSSSSVFIYFHLTISMSSFTFYLSNLTYFIRYKKQIRESLNLSILNYVF